MRTYPERDLDRPEALKGLLGTFWSDIYSDQEELDAHLRALALPWRQAARDLDAAADALAYDALPPLRVREWHRLVLRESDRRNIAYVGLRYRQDTAARYGVGYRYAEPAAGDAVPAPAPGLAEAPALLDAPAGATACLVAGLDYEVDAANGLLWLRSDPFADPRLRPTQVLDDRGQPVDRELVLYAWHAGLDERLPYRRLGYALGVDLPSSEAGRALAVAVVDALVLGTSRARLERFLSLVFDVPLCGSDGEVVEAVFEDAGGRAVATDRAVYRLGRAAAVLVSPGQALREGQPLCDALRFDELHRGTIPEGLRGLVLQGAAIDPRLDGAYTFGADEVPVEVIPTSPPQVRWPLGASPAQEERFWEAVHARGLAAGKVLANYLDRRPGAEDDPTADSLPAALSPLGFLLRNVWRGPVLLARLKAGAAGARAMNPKYLQLLRRLVPPHVLFLFEVSLPAPADDYTPDDAGVGLDDVSVAMPALQDEPPNEVFADPAPPPAWPLPEYNP